MSRPQRFVYLRIPATLIALFVCVGTIALPGAEDQAASDPAGLATKILDAAGVQGGLVVHLGCGDGELTAALRANNRYLVHGLDVDEKNVESARQHVGAQGLYGDVSIDRLSSRSLPYADDLVNLLVVGGGFQVQSWELARVLAPNGMAVSSRHESLSSDARPLPGLPGWYAFVKPWPNDIDQWSHYLHDATGNAVANDSRVAPPKRLRWVAAPLYCRSHEIDSSVSSVVSADGRIFYILDEGPTGITDPRLPAKWSLIARDAFSGVLLWKRPVPEWSWREWKPEWGEQDWTGTRGHRTRLPVTLTRRLVADGDRVYVTLGYDAPLTVLNAATGDVIRTHGDTEGTDEIVSSQGTIVIRVRKTLDDVSKRRTGETPRESIMAIKADTGALQWNVDTERLVPLSLAAASQQVFFHTGKAVVSLDLTTGDQVWRTSADGGSSGTLVVHDGVVLTLGSKKLLALSTETGEMLWTSSGGKGPGVSNPADLFVAGGLVWAGARRAGMDLRTGKVKKTIEVDNLISPGHHYRCYRSKATERFLLWPKRGVEFIILEYENHMRHDWLRAACKYGFMPANGLLYIPPHQCFCYAGVRLDGFNALAGEAKLKRRRGGISPRGRDKRFETGPALNHIEQHPVSGIQHPDAWPMHRHDAMRTGSIALPVPSKVESLWARDIGGRLTQPVVVGDRLFVASVDAHTVWCLSAATGRPFWTYNAGGRVDSPPTVYQGMVLFGSADGWVYCLRATDGELAWRFRAAPEETRIIAFDQLESPWPVHGSVLVKDGVGYFAAGRSSYLDGGIRVYGLDPASGKVLHQACLDGPHPNPVTDVGRPFDMEGTKTDILTTDGTYLYMKQAVFDSKLVKQEAPRITKMGDRKMGRHLFSTAGLLDGTWWNRTFWMYTERWPGFYIANQAPKTGQLLVFDDTTTYGIKCFTRRNRHSPMFFPDTDGYLLFADDNDNEPALVDATGNPKPVKWLPDVNPATGWALDTPAVDRDKGPGFTRTKPPKWAAWVPIRVRAMVLAEQTLFIAGPPDELDSKDPLAAFEGRKGGVLWAVSSADGKKVAEHKLDSPPVFDGMIAAGGKLYLSTRDGHLHCMGGS